MKTRCAVAPTSSISLYGYNNVFWHTPQDTVDKLSPKSLEIVGRVMLETFASSTGWIRSAK